ncbi:MAG TPA: helix-turn-helix transcriptional regulator [Rudaea sp.]|nr:helix-turn-helix transcriptional regulator [Rudaea sp.]
MTPDTTLKVRLGLVIRRHRERHGWTQEEFADATGLHTPYYGGVERGKQNLTLWNMQRVAAGLDVAVWTLLKEAEQLDLSKALHQPHKPPRVGRPRGRRSGYATR